MNKYLIIIAACLIAAGAWWFSRGGDESGGGRPYFGGPVIVATVTATQEPLVTAVEALGTTRANESVTLTSSITETVRRVNFEDGDFVSKGTVLIELTDNEEEAQLAEARANLRDAQRQLRRLTELDERGIAAASDVDEAQAAAEAAQARLDTVLARLEDRLVRAPFDGRLGLREVSAGTLLTPGDAITTIDDLAQMKLDFTVPETALAKMAPGKKIYAQSAAWPGRDFEGVVRAVDSRVDPVTRAVTVRAVIRNDDMELRPGMLLTVRVVTDEREAISVPERALVQVGASAFLYVVDDERIARRTDVGLGLRQAGQVEIVAGLEPGDLVVTDGVIKLRDGATVQFEGEVLADGPPDMVSGASQPADED